MKSKNVLRVATSVAVFGLISWMAVEVNEDLRDSESEMREQRIEEYAETMFDMPAVATEISIEGDSRAVAEIAFTDGRSCEMIYEISQSDYREPNFETITGNC